MHWIQVGAVNNVQWQATEFYASRKNMQRNDMPLHKIAVSGAETQPVKHDHEMLQEIGDGAGAVVQCTIAHSNPDNDGLYEQRTEY